LGTVETKKIKPLFRPKADAGQTPIISTQSRKNILSVEDQKVFAGWDWINPRFPKGITPEEEDVIFFIQVQDYPVGLQLYQHELSGVRGKIIFSLKEMPEKNSFLY